MFRDRLGRLGAAVRHRRRELGLTQDALGSPHVSKSFISQLEQGSVAPSLDTLFHISDTLELAAPRLLALSDPATVAEAALDMAEAAFLLGGRARADKWVKILESVIPIDKLHEAHLDGRWSRYVGLNKLAQRDYGAAVTFLEAAASDDTAVTTHYWLGIAHRRAGHLLQALRTWEFVVGLAPIRNEKGMATVRNPNAEGGRALDLIQAVTWGHLACLYDELGEPLEAERARARLHSSISAVLSATGGVENHTGHSSETDKGLWDPFRDTGWRRAGRMLANLLWTEAERAWHNDDIMHAANLARLIGPLM